MSMTPPSPDCHSQMPPGGQSSHDMPATACCAIRSDAILASSLPVLTSDSLVTAVLPRIAEVVPTIPQIRTVRRDIHKSPPGKHDLLQNTSILLI